MEKIYIAGIPVHLFSIDTLHETIQHTIQYKKKEVFLHANARLIELANTTESWLTEFFNRNVHYVMCDGAGVQLAARLTKQPIPSKIAYNTWIWHFLKVAAKNNYAIFLLGANEQTVNKAVEKIKKFDPRINITGYHHGYFDKAFDSSENKSIVGTINDLKPDILFVGFGMPIQELWVKENYNDLNCRAIFTCGGAFDFISGEKRVAPYIFRKLHMESVFRFLLEPVRLFSRITASNLAFLRIALKLRRSNGSGGRIL